MSRPRTRPERWTTLTADVDRAEHLTARRLAALTNRPVAWWIRVLLRRELAAAERDRAAQMSLPLDTSGNPTSAPGISL